MWRVQRTLVSPDDTAWERGERDDDTQLLLVFFSSAQNHIENLKSLATDRQTGPILLVDRFRHGQYGIGGRGNK